MRDSSGICPVYIVEDFHVIVYIRISREPPTRTDFGLGNSAISRLGQACS
jgi:hypothetical protein